MTTPPGNQLPASENPLSDDRASSTRANARTTAPREMPNSLAMARTAVPA